MNITVPRACYRCAHGGICLPLTSLERGDLTAYIYIIEADGQLLTDDPRIIRHLYIPSASQTSTVYYSTGRELVTSSVLFPYVSEDSLSTHIGKHEIIKLLLLLLS